MPRVLISDKLESIGLDLLRQANIEIDNRTGLKGAALQEALRRGRRHRSQPDADNGRTSGRPRQAARRRPGRRRRGQHRCRRRYPPRHRRHEYPRRQHGQHGRAYGRHADGFVAAHSRRRRQHQGRQVGKGQVRRWPTCRQDHRHHRAWTHRPRGGLPGSRVGHESDRVRSVPHSGARVPTRDRKLARSRSAPAALRFHHRTHPADKRNTRFDRRCPVSQTAAWRSCPELRSRRHHQRGSSGRGSWLRSPGRRRS